MPERILTLEDIEARLRQWYGPQAAPLIDAWRLVFSVDPPPRISIHELEPIQ